MSNKEVTITGLINSFNYFCALKGYVPLVHECKSGGMSTPFERPTDTKTLILCYSAHSEGGTVYEAAISGWKNEITGYRWITGNFGFSPQSVWDTLYFGVRI